jgi:hypothetical protein
MYEKHSFVAICIAQTVKFIPKTCFVDCNDISTAQNLADYAMLAFQAKSVLTCGIDMKAEAGITWSMRGEWCSVSTGAMIDV